MIIQGNPKLIKSEYIQAIASYARKLAMGLPVAVPRFESRLNLTGSHSSRIDQIIKHSRVETLRQLTRQRVRLNHLRNYMWRVARLPHRIDGPALVELYAFAWPKKRSDWYGSMENISLRWWLFGTAVTERVHSWVVDQSRTLTDVAFRLIEAKKHWPDEVGTIYARAIRDVFICSLEDFAPIKQAVENAILLVAQ